MIKKILFINYEVFTEKIRRDFVIDYLINNNIEIEYLDISYLFIGEMHISECNFVTIIKSYKELYVKLKSVDFESVLVIPLINLDGSAIRLYRLFTVLNLKIGFFSRGLFPTLDWSFIDKIKSFNINLKSLKNVILNQLSKFLKKIKFIKEYDYVFASGNVGSVRYANSIVKQVNFFDYDTYNTIKDCPSSIREGDFCVFLDVNAPFHPDLDLIGLNKIDGDLYFKELNHFFEKIEQHYGVTVIIAAHPSSNYDTNLFNGREIIKNKTAELVRDSKFVLSSASTSISYALLFNKPLIFHYTDDIKIKYNSFGYTDMCELLAKILSVPVYNISSNYELDETLSMIDISTRDKFIKDYYTSDISQNSSTQDLIIQYLKEI